jgi:transmembrane sensor
MDNSEKTEEIISKYLAGEATPEEAMQLEDWLKLSVKNRQQFKQSEKLFALANPSSKKLNLNQAQAWENVANETIKKVKIIPFYARYKYAFGIAASLLLIVSAYFILQKQLSANYIQHYTLAANHVEKEITLSDQTNIQIVAGSSIVYDENFGKFNRNVILNGSAYFTVKHSESLPFIVDLGNVFVKDLGTKFNIRLSADTDSIHINVDEGVVLLFDSASHSIEIKASERAIYIKSSKQILKPAPQNETVLNYDKTPLSKVISELEEKFSTKIMLANPKLNECTISAKFKDEDVNTILAVITETLGLTLEKQTDRFIIKGTACI